MSTTTLAAVAAVLAIVGGYLLYSSLHPSARSQIAPGRSLAARSPGARFREWAEEAGLGSVRPAEFASAVVALLVVGSLVAYALFGGLLPALATGVAVATSPLASYRARRRARLAQAAEAWPRILEELRLQIGSLGRSVPQALFEAGRRVPAEWRPAFAAAEREWLLTTDFSRTSSILKERLADPTADAVCETLLVAHEVGGSDVDGRLADLVEDRVLDLQCRKDAVSRQAGLRFARRFVLIVPVGMALAGLAIGTGRSSYESPGGQVAVVIAVASVVACWLWSARLTRLPDEPRVFR
jgi:tight adherence protein B